MCLRRFSNKNPISFFFSYFLLFIIFIMLRTFVKPSHCTCYTFDLYCLRLNQQAEKTKNYKRLKVVQTKPINPNLLLNYEWGWLKWMGTSEWPIRIQKKQSASHLTFLNKVKIWETSKSVSTKPNINNCIIFRGISLLIRYFFLGFFTTTDSSDRALYEFYQDARFLERPAYLVALFFSREQKSPLISKLLMIYSYETCLLNRLQTIN